MSRIYLIGFMGVGKSTLGKILSEKYACKFFDLDDVIEDRCGMTIPEIFRNYGEVKFRSVESSALYWLSKQENFIASLGGGTPCNDFNADLIEQSGYAVYLQLSNDGLYKRLENQRNVRPLLANLSDAEMKHFIVKKIEERSSYYEQAHSIISADGTIDALTEKLAKIIGERTFAS